MEDEQLQPKRDRAPRVLVSLTAKTQSELLSRALEARRLQRRGSQLFDPSVPQDMRFEGILPPTAAERPNVRASGQASLSPYVIYLSSPSLPSPHRLIDDGRTYRLNMLDGRSIELASDEPEEDPLALSTSDVSAQLGEDYGASRGRIDGHAEFLPPDIQPVSSILADGFDLADLTPAEAPTDFSTYFELPEEEESATDEPEQEGESEVMVLEIQDGQIGMTASATEPEPRRRIALPHGWRRTLVAFVVIALMFVVPIHLIGVMNNLREAKAAITDASASALSSLQNGASSALAKEPEAASADFAAAGANFADAQRSLEGLGGGLRLAGGSIVDLTQAGQSLSEAAQRVSDGFVALQGQVNPTPTDRLSLLATYFDSVVPHLDDAVVSLDHANVNAIPAEHRDEVRTLKDKLPGLVGQFNELLGFAHMANTVLGGDGIKRYLVVFQNNTELRPTGGFMGSFAEIEMVNGEIVRLDVPGGGTYDLRSGLSTYTAAPEPLQLLSARWEFQDLNWFPDFPTTARKLLEFFANAGGETVDGVIAVNATVVPSALQVLGPVDMPSYGTTVTADNFIDQAQRIVELDYDKTENKPKAFIGDLARAMLARATDLPPSQFPALLDLVNRSLVDRDVQIYFQDGNLEKRVRDLGWGGEIKWTDGDFLMPIDTNLGGGKTDGVIEENVDLDVTVAEDGTVTDAVKFTRTHYGVPGALFTGINNVDYLRLYVPKGSELVSASGFEIPDASLFDKPEADWSQDPELSYEASSATTDAGSKTRVSEEGGKTVFGNWIQTKPGTSSTATFTYRLPFKVGQPGSTQWLDTLKRFAGVPQTDRYSLVLQKQSGVVKRTTHVTVHVPSTLSTLWSSHELDGAAFGNDTDASLSALFERAK